MFKKSEIRSGIRFFEFENNLLPQPQTPLKLDSPPPDQTLSGQNHSPAIPIAPRTANDGDSSEPSADERSPS